MQKKNQRLLDDVIAVMRRLHYSIHTERSYCDWIKRYVMFHGFKSREALLDRIRNPHPMGGVMWIG